MQTFEFDTPVERHNTSSVKWDTWPDAEVLPLWVADMDFRTAPAVREALIRRAEHGVFGYTHPGDTYYNAITSWFDSRHKWHIERDHLVVTTGVVPALSATIKALAKPGEGVVILTPVYTCFFSSIRNNGCRIVESALRMDDEGLYRIDFGDLDTKLSDPTNTMLVLCNPHNPGGRVWTRLELERVAEIAAKHGTTVVSDEIHCEIVMPGHEYTPFANVCGGNCVSLISPSKAFNTAGLQVANIVVPDAERRAAIDRAININETCDVGPFGVVALEAAYTKGAPWLEAMISYVSTNYVYLKEQLDGVAGIRVLPMEGTYLAWLDCKAIGRDVQELCDDMRLQAKVWLHPGTMYGADGQGYVRINLATSRSTLAEALRRIRVYLEA